MKTKIVYVLISDYNDFYVEMLQLSLFSLRLYHPNDPVYVVMDNETHQRLVKAKSIVLSDVVPIVVPVPYDYPTLQRSRYLKTSLRSFIDGDILYLDTDTIICSSLNKIDSFLGDFCAVLDNHLGETLESTMYPTVWRELVGVKQFNGGVFIVKDTDIAHSFFQKWHECWKYSVSQGCPLDQPALRKAIHDSAFFVQELDGIWNCQVNRPTSMEFQKDAIIMHYQRAGFYVSEVCRSIRNQRKVCGKVVELASNPHIFLSGKLLYITEMELSSLSSLRRILYDYPAFFSVLSKLAEYYAYVMKHMFALKQRFLKCIKR